MRQQPIKIGNLENSDKFGEVGSR